MNKKFGFVFLGLGVILLGIFALYNWTDLFVNKTPSNNNSQKNDIVINYDYVKSYDMDEKIKISFPLHDGLIIDDYYSDDFYKYYTSESGLSLMASIIEKENLNDDNINSNDNQYKELYQRQGKKLLINRIECNYSCSRYQVLNEDNSVYVDFFKVYYKISKKEVFELVYQQEKKNLSHELIDLIISNIKITYDAVYSSSVSEGNKLIINLKMPRQKSFTMKLDSTYYEEVINGMNSNRFTTVKNKNDDSEIKLFVQYKRDKISLEAEIDEFFNSKMKREISLGTYKGYEYDITNNKAYAIIINDETVLLLSPKKGTININDFSDIVIQDI